MSGLDLLLSQRTLAMMFVYAAAVGFVLGGVYDFFRLIRFLLGDASAYRPRRPLLPAKEISAESCRPLPMTILLFVEDVLFGIVASLALILLLYYTNDGQFRAPAVIGMACGFFVYSHTLHHPLMAMAVALSRALRALLMMLWRVGRRLFILFLWRPLSWLSRIMVHALGYLWHATVGRHIERRRSVRTDRAIAALTEAAAHGFVPDSVSKHDHIGHSEKKDL